MNPFHRCRIPLVAAILLLFATAAGAEAIFNVNDTGTGTWAYDQPAATAFGDRIHLAFVGDSTGTGSFKLYYAVVAGEADFTSSLLARSGVLVTPPVAIDNGDPYTDARHPRIVLRAENQATVVFQAVPAGLAAGDYRLFRALITVENNAVTTQIVREIMNADGTRMTGTLSDPSFRIVPADGTLRVAYTDNSSGLGNVSYARVGIDNAVVVDVPIPLSTSAGSQGVQPLPRLQLDGNNFSHIAWAANGAGGTASGIYYAMVQDDVGRVSGAADNLAIGATLVIPGRVGFPNVLPVANTSMWVLAAEEPPADQPGAAGILWAVALNPYAVIFNGQPANVSNVGANATFLLSPPGISRLPNDFSVYHPEITLDSQLRANVAGYGFRSDTAPFLGWPGRYYSMGLGSATTSTLTQSFASMAYFSVLIGTGDKASAMQTPGDYTRPAFVHMNGKAIQFWSGPDDTVAGARNLYVTSVSDAFDSSPQSGCSAVGGVPGAGANGIPEAAVLLLPLALLLIRRTARRDLAR
jgi:hypothetical protein